MINSSLLAGHFPKLWKEALVDPRQKKEGINDFSNLPPVSNLQYVSKLTERAVFDQVHVHLNTHDLYPKLQSAYRRGHSTETALLKMHNDTLIAMDREHVILLVLLDPSAAFDTVEHSVLLSRLSNSFGIRDTALRWFRSYLSDRSQRLSLDDDTNTYEKLTSDPTRAIKNKLIQTLKEWRKEERIPNYLYNQLCPTAENVPKFYGLPKIHKKDVPLRPIVSSVGSVMYDTAKFLAKIMKPLIGLNSHHIVNSEDFVNKIAELEAPPGQKLVSYDVSSLFTSIPINEAIPVVGAKLESDQSLPDRCPVLLEMCLSSTYFTFQGEFYKQKKGAAMGSPISPVVANLYMEQFESRALDTAPTPPTMWYRYVDDTMAKIHENAVDSFSEHLNSIDQHIQFTSEQEKDGRIPFLDTCVSINQDGSTKISVYRKPTHTDQYLNFQSNHHLQHKRAVVNTLMLRAQTLVTENDDRTRETQHVKQALKMNNYPEWMLTIPHPKSTTEDTEEPQNEKKIYASTPYIKGISERLQRAFKSHEVTLIHKPVNSLRSQLVRVKDTTVNLKKCDTVYQIHSPSL
ncbi:uncharacterized protein [Montipora foliosa]|uniref:uncharacterized protein n=1 Tax=Montipora foliosa TaxID=591990 RepID=UPI0035F12DD4